MQRAGSGTASSCTAAAALTKSFVVTACTTHALPFAAAPPATGAGADLRFDYVARFGVAVPILSFTALWNPAGGEQHDTPAVELHCVQTTAVQQYSLDPRLCYAGDSGEWGLVHWEASGCCKLTGMECLADTIGVHTLLTEAARCSPACHLALHLLSARLVQAGRQTDRTWQAPPLTWQERLKLFHY